MKDNLTYDDILVEILDRQFCRLRNKEVTSVKVFWRSQSIKGATWEVETVMRASTLTSFFPIQFQLEVIVPLQSLNLLLVNSASLSCSLSYPCISASLHVHGTQFS